MERKVYGPAVPSPKLVGPSISIRSRWPTVARELELKGCDPVRGADESREAHENRVGTALMGVFRDTRDPAAFEALYTFSGPAILGWIRGLLGREHAHLDPAEVLQDTFVNVYRYPAGFREEHRGSFRVWVRTIAGNVVRRGAVARARVLHNEGPVSVDIEDEGVGDPIRTVVDEDEARRLRRAWALLLLAYAQAWNELAPRDRRTLHLVEVEELSYREAGRILGVGRSNMKMIVFRARRRMARRMREMLGAGVRDAVAP